MSTIQILWLNMITSSPIALALGMEKGSKDIMNNQPRSIKSSLFSKEMMYDTFFYGSIMGITTLLTFIFASWEEAGNFSVFYDLDESINCNSSSNFDKEECLPAFVARGVSFYTLTLLLLLHGYNCRHQRVSGFFRPRKFATNKLLGYAVIFGIVCIIPTSYIPFINSKVFLQDMIGWQWGLIVASVVFFIGMSELYKYTKRHFLDNDTFINDDESLEIQRSVSREKPM